MKLVDFLYFAKPLFPRYVQITTRKLIAKYKRNAAKRIWPINYTASKIPNNWRGWPESKKFAVVLSHDVDTKKGLEQCMDLLHLEKELGFKSSFNFVAADYGNPISIIHRIREYGFDVGIHGLHHDAKLFSNKEFFDLSVPLINATLKKWDSVGFHSPSMHRNLDWLSHLDIEYSSTTFDTDPFEPQPDGVNTVFPLWIDNPKNNRSYVELPYTLPQDHCLFIILKEKDISIWKNKLRWIADLGGMVFLNTHPDYMNFKNTRCSIEEYPVRLYREFLHHIQTEYSGQYWHATPRSAATFYKSSVHLSSSNKKESSGYAESPSLPIYLHSRPTSIFSSKIWIDLDNTPHVPFFIPIIRELERRGHSIILTARDAFQVCELADKYDLPFIQIGRHYGKHKLMKIIGLFIRSAQLASFFLPDRPDLALSHGSRSQALYGNMRRVPTAVIADYEYTKTIPLAYPRWLIVPEVVSKRNIRSHPNRVLHYRGIKEDVYVPEFKPDPSVANDLGIKPDNILVTIRPPADEAHYHNPESIPILIALMKTVFQRAYVQGIFLPRNKHQELFFKKAYPDWFAGDKFIIPTTPVNGLDLIWLSDLVVSGGGTMNREAAALNVPVFSIFRGKKGAVDQMLEREGRLIMIQNEKDVSSKIAFVKRERPLLSRELNLFPALKEICDHIEYILQEESRLLVHRQNRK